jgi:hypothetical protein
MCFSESICDAPFVLRAAGSFSREQVDWASMACARAMLFSIFSLAKCEWIGCASLLTAVGFEDCFEAPENLLSKSRLHRGERSDGMKE